MKLERYLVPLIGGVIIGALIAKATTPQSRLAHAYATTSINYLGVVAPITSAAVVGDFGDSADTPKVMAKIKTYPTIIDLGDNAYDKGTASKVDSWWNKYLKDYGGALWGAFGNEDNKSSSAASKYASLFKISNWNYSFDSGIAHFLCLNTEKLPSQSVVEADLKAAKDRGLKWMIAYQHKPCKSPSAKHKAENTWLTKAYQNQGVDLVLQAHNHFYVRYSGSTNSLGAKTYYFLSGLGGRDKYKASSLPTNVKKYINNTFGYMEINIADDGLRTKFFDTTGTQLDAFKITKPAP